MNLLLRALNPLAYANLFGDFVFLRVYPLVERGLVRVLVREDRERPRERGGRDDARR